MDRNKLKFPVICFLCLLMLTLGGCGEISNKPSGAPGDGGSYSSDRSQNSSDSLSDSPQSGKDNSSNISQSNSGSSSDSQTESSSQDDPPSEEQGVKGGIIRSGHKDTEEYPNELVNGGNGTQAELVRFRELLRSPELYTINAYTFDDWQYDKKMTDEQAQAIVDYYINAPISPIPPDKLLNPSTGGSNYVKGYDKDGNFLFEANDNTILSVRFADGMMYDFYLDGQANLRNILF